MLGLVPASAVNVTFSTDGEAQDVALNGLGLYIMPCGFLGTIESLVATATLFDGSSEAGLEAANVDFLTQRGVWPSPAVPFGKNVTVDPSAIRSGDYVAIGRLDGLDPMIMWAVGGVTGHSAVAVWEGSELYVVEATDKNPFGGSYWPPPYGIIRTPFQQWVAQAHGARYHVTILPIRDDLAAAFDEGAFWAWFVTVAGMPYGYHTMLYTFMDVGPSNGNLPLPVAPQSVTAVLNMAEASGLLPNSTAGISAFSMITWGANKRLNTTCDSLACLIRLANTNAAAGSRPSNLLDILAIPDNDDWYFGPNVSEVCSEFASHAWKVGLQGKVPVFADIIANEQSPKDNYQSAIYAPGRFNDANCPGGVQTPPSGKGTVCQLMGPWTVVLNDYNTVPVYAGMNNACPAQWPEYVRCPPNDPTCC